jgi:NADH:ubiquinone oxidoreductase subunit F (NADH-binding)
MTTNAEPGLLPAAAPDLATHLARSGPLPSLGRGTLIGLLERAGLTGRGGAGFPTHRKLAAVLVRGSRPVVVANAAEGEPASAKDVALLRHAPHLVLDGLALIGEAVGAKRAVLYAVPGPGLSAARAALAERAAARVDRLRVEVVEAPDAFVSGEETALVSRVEGRAALPKDKLRMVVERGVDGRPTVVDNAETLAHVALIARHGPEWFRRAGTAREPGTMLTTVSGAVVAPGVYEVEHGEPIAAVIERSGGSLGRAQAVLVGGYHGAWLPASELAAARLSRESLTAYGASPGAGVLVVLPEGACGLAETARIAGYLAGQTAGQCGPCLNGLPAMAATLAALARGERDPRLVPRVEWLARLVEGRGACHHPDGTVRMVRSALRTFAADVDAHLSGRCVQAMVGA